MQRQLDLRLLFALLSLLSLATAQFGFFDQMFGNQGEQRQQQRSNPSDASNYRAQFEQSVCDHYLCPDTLACVHFPHHCPCPWDAHDDKFETTEGHRLCASKGGFKDGETARKVELARKGLI